MNPTLISPVFAVGVQSHALSFAWKHLTQEGLCTIVALLIVSIFSWTVIVTKARQLMRAKRMGKKFFKAYRETRDPMEIARRGDEFDGAPAYELYYTGAEEIEYQLKNNPVQVEDEERRSFSGPPATGRRPMLSRGRSPRRSAATPLIR